MRTTSADIPGMKTSICVVGAMTVWIAAVTDVSRAEPPLKLQMRRRVETAPGTDRWHAIVEMIQWNPRQTAIVVCDMWNDHYCVAAAKRVAEMAPHMNRVLNTARNQGVLIIHCPSGCMDKYQDTPQRKLAQQAPPVPLSAPLAWCFLNPLHEAPMPVSDKDPCDDEMPRPAVRFFERQIDSLEIKDGDAISDNSEVYFLMKQRGITNVLVMGVHTNMCVLGRPFSIRQMIYQGMNVALVRDLTDSMYNPRREPFVNHFTGNDLVVEHIERYWCPTVTSADILGDAPFRFRDDRRPHLAVVMSEDEYRTEETLPKFCLANLGNDFRISLVYGNWMDGNDIPGIEVLREADVAIWSLRRRTLPKSQLDEFRRFVESGKPLVALRTTSHAFCLRNKKPDPGFDEWPEFDRQILGGHYQNHHGNQLTTHVRPTPQASGHPIMSGVSTKEFRVFGSLYRSSPLASTATPLMTGRVEGAEVEPVAWTNTTAYGGRVFYTSLGHVGDFELADFQTMLRNATCWAAGIDPTPVP